MRTIKFRAWAKNTPTEKSMWNWGMFRHRIAEWIGNEEPTVVLMQFTGLTDKNGKEIYEGDIVSDDPRNHNPQEVTFHNGLAGWMPFVYHGGGEISPFECEVIGNIYENPELNAQEIDGTGPK